MRLAPLPSQASWRHAGLRDGFEVVWPVSIGSVHRLRGATTGVEDGAGWTVSYDVELGADWCTRTAVVRASGRDGSGEVLLERDEDDRWSIDGLYQPELDGVADVDLESSAVTNTLPLHRLHLERGSAMRVDSAFVGLDLRVQRIVQTYELVEHTDERITVAYTSATFDVACTVTFDGSGLVTDYPDIAVRHA
ncbi:putative glycolipid-binding domain-containing protein [Nocardioides sp.]|uniref:putative glycolipid-binding domain-containing protein n=1 Tax=Nocardioides sp. TaxID=35761 RepID=UPI00271BCF03|nr:putative glycolipid-binding domain-containing protein [Nocardioides sp.]MDO9456787.1 putative glycolipid-binding domain-containing protein [Nocardioides sp.]